MTANRRIREAAVVVGTLATALLALRMSRRNPGELFAHDRAILTLTAPAQAGLSSLARGIGNAIGRYAELVHVRSENESLRSDNARLRAELLETRRMASESTRYQKLLGLRDSTAAETLAARVISIDASPYFRVARIELDRGAGLVRHGMPVITPDGVVGRINKINGNTSDILLAVDPRSAIDVVLPRTGGRGILRGRAGENGYRCTIEYLTRGETAKEGDLVLTSGLVLPNGLGGLFPRDLPVGRVTRAAPASSGLYQDIEVVPEVNFARLSEVLVVVAPPPAPDPDAGSRRPAAPVRGLSVYR